MNYIECIGRSYPNVAVSCTGAPDVYSDITWEGGDPLPSEGDLQGAQLANAQEDMWLAISSERDRREADGVKLNVNGTDYWFWTDVESRARYAMLGSIVFRNNLPDDYVLDQWKTMSGEFVPFTVDLLHQVIDSGAVGEESIFNVAERHKAAMLLLSDPTQYNFSTGWPQSYHDTL